ncbi:hypothetical protein D3C71_1464760 [compost metagenome]
MHRHAVGVGTWLKLIGQAQLKVALMPGIRIVQRTDLIGTVLDQHLFFKAEQIRVLFCGVFPPVVKMTPGDHVARDALIVETEQGFIINQNVTTARLMLQLLHFRTQLQVGTEECMARLPVAFHQRMADKQFPAQQRIYGAVINLSRSDDGQPEQRHFFGGHHRTLGFRPMGFAVAVLHQVLG